MVQSHPAEGLNRLRVLATAAATMVFFAANSWLARFALGEREIDAAGFTAVRVFSGAVVLALLTAARRRQAHGSWTAAGALFLYAIAFSLAYLSLDAGVGALVLFAAVQVTMIGGGMRRGERTRTAEWLGLVLAMAGLAYLVSPGASAPSLEGAALMAAAGAAWGFYSLAAKGVRDPVAATAGNFLRAFPMAAAILLLAGRSAQMPSRTGLALAAVSGAVTSGLGYALWYRALRELSATRAAIVQLTVPVIAAAGGVLFLGERLTWRLALAAMVILGGVALAVLGPQTRRAAR